MNDKIAQGEYVKFRQVPRIDPEEVVGLSQEQIARLIDKNNIKVDYQTMDGQPLYLQDIEQNLKNALSKLRTSSSEPQI